MANSGKLNAMSFQDKKYQGGKALPFLDHDVLVITPQSGTDRKLISSYLPKMTHNLIWQMTLEENSRHYS
eukprot:6557745-Ditylum_brightwellii.AAC.1